MYFECNICCEDKIKITIGNRSNRIICPNCNYVVCVKCQKMFKSDMCMKCHMKFKLKFIYENIGKNFYNTIIKPKIINDLLNEQKQLLPLIKPVVEWEKNYREYKKMLRFGKRITLPSKPIILQKSNYTFPCPVTDCRGFVTYGKCGTCNINVCMTCHEKSDHDHKCDDNIVQNIIEISNNTKPCPKCTTPINKTFGCNHMFCTNCRTHFDWETGTIMNNSSNHHYINLATFNDNVATLNTNTNNPVNICEFSLYRDKIPFDNIINKQYPQDIINVLYKDSNSIRLAKRKMFNEQDITNESYSSNIDLCVKYMLKDITEKQWANQIYSITKKTQLKLLYANVINIYLGLIDIYQIKLKNINDNEIDKFNQIRIELTEMINLCNDSFASIQDEYGGSLLKIRNINDNEDAPAFIL